MAKFEDIDLDDMDFEEDELDGFEDAANENEFDTFEETEDDFKFDSFEETEEGEDFNFGSFEEDNNFEDSTQDIDNEESSLDGDEQEDYVFDATDLDDSHFVFDDSYEQEDDMTTEDFVRCEEDIIDNNNIFNEDGDIVVMDKGGEAFELKYIPMKDILIPDRIRKSVNVTALQRSIESTGLLKPITVARTATDGIYVLLDGYKRMYASGKAGLKEIASVINNKVSTTEISILEALYNHYTSYTTKEKVDYIKFLEEEKEIRNQNTIEYLLQMEPGDYPKLKDILNDNDPDIVDGLFSGKFTIEQAFNKLKAKRAKQSKEEKELEKAERVYGDTESGVSELENSGDMGHEPLSEEEIAELGFAVDGESLEDTSLEQLMEEGDSIGGYEPNQQKVGEREFLDADLRKSVLARDNNSCVCCGLGGNLYANSMDIHHTVRVADGGKDTLDNLITACILCHSLIHQWSAGTLHIGDIEKLDGDEKEKFKKIVAYGNHIRKVAKKAGKKAEDLKKDARTAGRNMPGGPQKVD